MKKILLSVVVLVAFCMAATASVTTNPELNYFTEDFKQGIPKVWTQFGAGKTAAGQAQDYFPVGGDSYQALKFSDGTVFAMSNSWTQEGGVVDEWLVTPAIEVPVDAAMLVYTVMAYGANTDSNYAVYVSTTGNKREDFAEAPIYDAKLKGNGAATQRTNRHNLEGYAGQKIYIAFVNASNDAFMLGFSDIKICQYDIAVTNQTPSFTLEAGDTKLDLTVQVKTPFACSGYTATLTTNTGINEVLGVEKNLKSSYSSTKPIFSPITLTTKGQAVEYTVTIAPKAEGATPTVVRGSVALADTYPGVCVMEEATGEYCSYCPRGIAALDYFTATYGDRFIGIAVHCGAYSTGVMEYPSYEPLLYEGISGFPAAVFNRTEVSDPASEAVVKRMIDKRSPAKIEINNVVYNPEVSQQVTVNYSTTLGYTVTDPNIGVAAVVIADGLTGTDTQRWCQMNAYSGTSKASIVSMYGEAWWPYFQWICESPSTITNMEFNHVACGIYNDYYGETGALNGTYNMGQPKTSTLTFDMPLQTKPNGPGVQDVSKTSIVVLLIDLQTGEIIGGDKLKASDYIVTEETSSFKIEVNGVEVQDGDIVEITELVDSEVLPCKAMVPHVKLTNLTANPIDAIVEGEFIELADAGAGNAASIIQFCFDSCYAVGSEVGSKGGGSCSFAPNEVREGARAHIEYMPAYEGMGSWDVQMFYPGVSVFKFTLRNSKDTSDSISVYFKFNYSESLAETILLNTDDLTLLENETATLTATVLPETAANKTVTWSSSNEAVAIVDANGLVTAISVGEAIITATTTDGSDLSASCKVTVVPTLATSITLDKTEISLEATETATLIAIVLPELATDKSVEWSSSNESVATIDANGLVTAIAVGEAIITATTADGSNLSATCKVTVLPTLATYITLDKTEYEIAEKSDFQLVATVLPELATDKGVVWSSSDKWVASVNENGLVTAYSVGEAIITATTTDGSNLSASCKVTVVPTLATSIELDKTEISLEATETATLVATVLPELTTNKSVTWTSSNDAVAIVDKNGFVTAIAVGEATITATTTDGSNLSATCKVTVVPTLATSIELDKTEISLEATETATLVATVLPELTTDKSVKWSSSDETVVVVDENGVVTAVAVGEATITATTVDDSNLSATCKVTVIPTLAVSIELDQTEASVEEKSDLQLTATILPEHATNREVAWSSSDKWVATVDNTGLVTIHSAGEVIITATTTDGTNLSATCSINVYSGIDGVNGNDVIVATIGDNIIVKNAKLGSNVRVYATDGSIITSEIATDGDVVIEAPVKGIYVVAIDGKSFKVMVK